LSRIDKFRPKIAIFLNATDNHLDRHFDFKDYFNAKMRIFENQTKNDWAIINYEDKNIMKNASKIRAKKIFFSPSYHVIARARSARSNDVISNFASVEDERMFLKIGRKKIDICKVEDLKIRGRHNVENALAVISAAFIFGLAPEKIAKAIRTFEGLEHRCEDVAVVNGVRFINDSKSTTVDAAIKALSCCEGKIVLIAGGRDKNANFSPIRRYLRGKVKTLILIGESKEKIRNALSGSNCVIKDVDSLEQAVESAFNIAGRGESVLFSPMCTSFDMFENFEHRGRVFKDAVKRLHLACAKQE
jgi:UDP-N-acetylmuramoylalanine--D-glutamate ligase